MPKASIVAMVLMCCALTPAPFVRADAIREASFEVNSGIRQDRLTWDTSGIVEYYDTFIVSSELDWDDQDIYEFGATGRLVVENGYMPFATCLRIRGSYGEIYDGKVRDSDYISGSDGTYEFSRSISDSDDGDTLALNVGIGPQFMFWNDKISIAALVGYNYQEQNLTMTDGLQVLGTEGITPTPGTYLPELDSSYDASWEGAWIGVDASVRLHPRLTLAASVEVQDVNYEAEADWNLRTDLEHPVSFEHEADGLCIMSSLAAQYLLNDSWALSANVNYGYMVTDDGTHTAYGSDDTVTRVNLNEVEWESIGATLGLRWIF